MTFETFRDSEEKLAFVQSLSFGTKLNDEKKKADNGITKNKYRNGTSDEANQAVYERFKDTYGIDVYKENGFEHIRLYDPAGKRLYVLIREGTYKEQLDASEGEHAVVHYLKAYAYMNRHLLNGPLVFGGQLLLFDDESGGAARTEQEYFIRRKAKEVVGNREVESVCIIAYEASRGNVISVKARIPHPNLWNDPIYEEDLSDYIVTYDNEDELTGTDGQPHLPDSADETQKQIIAGMLKLKKPDREGQGDQ